MNPKEVQKVKVSVKEQEQDKNRVRNHFRNICFRKKFPTIKENIKYIADYYDIDEVSVIVAVQHDLIIIKEQTGLK